MILDKLTTNEKEQMRIAYMWFGHLRTIPVQNILRIFDAFGSPVAAFDAIYKDERVLDGLVEANAIKADTKEEILNDDVEMWYEWNRRIAKERGIGCVTPIDENYPSRLQDIGNKPVSIYYRGDIKLTEWKTTLGVIGSRRPTFYGKSVTDKFVNELTARGVTIVSGMAYGIDAIAHKSAIEHGGKTIAVLGGGVDICYPQTNIEIYSEMCENHLVLSEYEPEVAPIGLHFPLRNRIISGLSDGLLVSEATLSSGTMITAEYALDLGKTIYGIPGRIDDASSKGVHKLIKQGALLVDDPSDVIKDIFSNSFDIVKPISTISNRRKKNKIDDLNLPPTEKKIIGLLGSEPTHMDDIIRNNNMKISETIHILNDLVKRDIVECIEKSYYILK